MNFLKKIKGSLLAFLLLTLSLLVVSNLWIVNSTNHMVFYHFEDIPENEVALVLGTSNKLVDGSPNPFFENRMETAFNLYQKGKVKHFILSGDNRTKYYNEPLNMQKALLGKGVPASAITLDYAGLRTLDSIVRCKEIFGQQKVTIITQPFHSFRALFISRHYGLDAVAMVTEEVSANNFLKVKLREYLARPKALWDLYIINKGPRHLGKKEVIKLL